MGTQTVACATEYYVAIRKEVLGHVGTQIDGTQGMLGEKKGHKGGQVANSVYMKVNSRQNPSTGTDTRKWLGRGRDCLVKSAKDPFRVMEMFRILF